MANTRARLRRFGIVAGAVVAAGLPAGPVVAAAAPSPATVQFELPHPTGRHPIGVTDLHLVDGSRPDPWDTSLAREVMVTIRYPASGSGRPAPFMPAGAAEVAAAAGLNVIDRAAEANGDADKVRVDASELDYGFPTHSRAGAPVAWRRGGWPVVLYSPGVANYSRAFGTALTEDLASHGYVVVSIDHTHDAVAVEFPDGRVVASEVAKQKFSLEVAQRVIDARVADTRFVLDQLHTLAGGDNPDAESRRLPARLGQLLDLSRVGMFGHSGGGFAAAETMLSDRRIDAGANLDGTMDMRVGKVAAEGLDRPFLLMSAGDHTRAPDDPAEAKPDESWEEFLRTQRGWVRHLHIPAGEHASYTDLHILLPQLANHLDLDPDVATRLMRRLQIGDVDPGRSVASQRAYLTALFEEHLRGWPQPLLDGPSPQHPDVTFRH
jgi:predicted dienelactone hydrolase